MINKFMNVLIENNIDKTKLTKIDTKFSNNINIYFNPDNKISSDNTIFNEAQYLLENSINKNFIGVIPNLNTMMDMFHVYKITMDDIKLEWLKNVIYFENDFTYLSYSDLFQLKIIKSLESIEYVDKQFKDIISNSPYSLNGSDIKSSTKFEDELKIQYYYNKKENYTSYDYSHIPDELTVKKQYADNSSLLLMMDIHKTKINGLFYVSEYYMYMNEIIKTNPMRLLYLTLDQIENYINIDKSIEEESINVEIIQMNRFINSHKDKFDYDYLSKEFYIIPLSKHNAAIKRWILDEKFSVLFYDDTGKIIAYWLEENFIVKLRDYSGNPHFKIKLSLYNSSEDKVEEVIYHTENATDCVVTDLNGNIIDNKSIRNIIPKDFTLLMKLFDSLRQKKSK